jgi:hypothetical protein
MRTELDMAIDTKAAGLDHLDPAIQKVEFKLTVLAGEEGKVQDLLQRLRAQPRRRKVYFFDTRELALYKRNLVLRARVTDGEDDDSTVKLRPVDLTDGDAGWRRIDGIRIELDVVGDKQVSSAKLDGEPDRGEIEEVEAGRRGLGSLFSGKQERLLGERDASLHGLEVLGPVDARKWDLDRPDGFPHPLTVEEWSLPDATHFIELSFKVPAAAATGARTDFRALVRALGLDLLGDQAPKTARVLEFFAARLGG